MKYYLFIQIFMVGALLQGFGSLVGAASQNVNINKSIKAQQEENQKNRDYNLQLAKMQNEWNLQQWERENEYNNPLNQMARLKAAGLNPNLVYGNGAGQTTSAPSPNLTSGAPSSPVDMSLLAQRPTVGQIMNQALQNRSIQAQIDKTDAETRKTLADAGISETDLKYRDAFNALGLDDKQLDINMKSQAVQTAVEEFNLLKQQIEQSKVTLQGMKLDVFRKKIENAFREKEMEQILKKLTAEAKISENDAKFAVESYASRLLLTSSNAYIAADNAAIPKFLEGIKDDNSLGNIGATLFQAVRYILGFINPLL